MPRLISPKAPSSVDAEIGRRIRAQRALLQMSQTELANAVGVTFQQIQKYEKGLNRVGGGRLSQMAKTLQVPPSFFFEGAGPGLDGKGLNDTIDLVRSQGSGRILKALASIEDTELRQLFGRLVEKVAESVSAYERRRHGKRGRRAGR